MRVLQNALTAAPEAVAARRREKDVREAPPQFLAAVVFGAGSVITTGSSVVEGVVPTSLEGFVQHGRHPVARADVVRE